MTEEQQLALIQHLYALAEAEDRAALAALRRGAGKKPGTEIGMYQYVVPYIPDKHREPNRAWPYFCVASLFATNPRRTERQERFGATYRLLEDSGSRDARFRALLNSHEEELPNLLRHAVRQLVPKEIPVNWDLLLKDLRNWGDPKQYVQQRWAQQYWAPEPEHAEEH